MDGLSEDHLKQLVVRNDSETPAKKVVMEILNAMHNGQTLTFNVAVVSFSWCQLCLQRQQGCYPGPELLPTPLMMHLLPD